MVTASPRPSAHRQTRCSSSRRSCRRVLQKSGTEMLFGEGGNEFWIAVQRPLVDPPSNVVGIRDSFTAYVIWMGAIKSEGHSEWVSSHERIRQPGSPYPARKMINKVAPFIALPPQAALLAFAVRFTPKAFITASVVLSVGFPSALKERSAVRARVRSCLRSGSSLSPVPPHLARA